jgi:hypothetical protein
MSQLLFSLSHVQNCAFIEIYEALKFSKLKCLEIPGVLFERADYIQFKELCFKKNINVWAVHELVPPGLSRNWASSTENIRGELKLLMLDSLALAALRGVKSISIDLSLDSIRDGFEVNEVDLRFSLLNSFMKIAQNAGMSVNLPVRFPKEFPKSKCWLYATMLLSKVLHEKIGMEVSLFVAEARLDKVKNLLKNGFYFPKIIRLCYDPFLDGPLEMESLTQWLEVFREQGYTGDFVLAPRVDSVEQLNQAIQHGQTLIDQIELI